MNLEPGTPSGRTFLAVLERHSSPTKHSSEGGGGSVKDRVCPRFAFDRRLRPPSRHYHSQLRASKHVFPNNLAQHDQRHHRHGSSRRGPVYVGGRFRHHDQASGRSRQHSTRHTPPTRPLLRRSSSVGDIPRSSQLVTRRSGTTKEQAPSPAGRALFGFSTRPAGSSFAEKVIELQQHRHQQRKRDRLEVKRRQEKEHAKAKAVACQLACRVLCRSHRARVLAAALWRWRTQAAGLKIEQGRRDEQIREHEQVTIACLVDCTIQRGGFLAVAQFCFPGSLRQQHMRATHVLESCVSFPTFAWHNFAWRYLFSVGRELHSFHAESCRWGACGSYSSGATEKSCPPKPPSAGHEGFKQCHLRPAAFAFSCRQSLS